MIWVRVPPPISRSSRGAMVIRTDVITAVDSDGVGNGSCEGGIENTLSGANKHQQPRQQHPIMITVDQTSGR